MNTADFASLNQMSFAEFSARSIRLTGVKAADFASMRTWCETTYAKEDHPVISAGEERHDVWTVRASFFGEKAMENATLFRMFWDH